MYRDSISKSWQHSFFPCAPWKLFFFILCVSPFSGYPANPHANWMMMRISRAERPLFPYVTSFHYRFFSLSFHFSTVLSSRHLYWERTLFPSLRRSVWSMPVPPFIQTADVTINNKCGICCIESIELCGSRAYSHAPYLILAL